MQFYLRPDELNFLANVLLEQDLKQYGEILDKVMARDLRFDAGELIDTATILETKKQSLRSEIAAQPDAARKAALESKLEVLERVLDRVNEACVMF